ncbi:MAG: hypothetical protein LLF76_15210 [Planctomycetaceae bacterium]|nr:hypothetical protein [Planctomycetaceae bacterium]
MRKDRLWFILMILSLGTSAAWSATVSFSVGTPSDVNDFDSIANVLGAAQDRDNVAGDGTTDGPGNDGATYVAPDRSAQGQTFVTGSVPKMLAGVWVRLPGYFGSNPGGEAVNNTYWGIAAGNQLMIRITNPVAAGTAGFVLHNETYAFTGLEPDFPASGNSADGPGTWLYIQLDNPRVLAPNTAYGFDVGAAGGFFELLGIRDAAAGGNPYSGGAAYSSGANGIGNNAMTAQAGDRVFVIKIDPLRSGVSNPDPADGAAGIDTDAAVTLSWDAGGINDPLNPGSTIPNPDITYHYLYLSRPSDPNLLDIAPALIASDIDPADGNVDPSASLTLGALLESDAVYYWRVDEIMANPADPNNITGTVWSFATELKRAQLDPTYPRDASVAVGEQAAFTVAPINPLTGDSTGMTYQWYRNGSVLAGQTSAQYARTALADDDRSTYYCVVTVTATAKTIQSRSATLFIEKQIAYWTLDGNVNDSSPDALYNGTAGGTAVFDTDRKVGTDALLFNGTDTYVDLPDGMDSFGGGLTFTLWAKPTAAGSWARFLDFGNGAPDDNIYLSRAGTADTLHLSVYSGTVASSVDAVNAVTSGEWQMLSVTMDREGDVVMYKNGAAIQTGTVTLPNTVVRTLNYIGRSNWTADAYYQGLMDDIQVYNYALTADEIAQKYTLVTGGVFCQESPAYDLTGPAGTPDCRVDIYELSGMAADWLGCGIYPDCL